MSSICNNNICITPNRENFWMDDFTELYKNNNYLKFYPTYEMTRTEQLNSITRFLIYVMILVLLFSKTDKLLYIPITGLAIIVVIYNIYMNDSLSKTKEFNKIQENRKRTLKDIADFNRRELQHDDEPVYDDVFSEKSNFSIETAYYDSNNDLTFSEKSNEESIFNIDEVSQYRKDTCRKPTADNPFMNPSVTDYNTFNVPTACNADDDDIKNDMRVGFNNNLFKNVEDIWGEENSRRQFYTVPNTMVPNNQVEFAKWLYKAPLTCKEDQDNCIRYENNLQYQR